MLQDQNYINSLGMRLVRLEGGAFVMGADPRPLDMEVAVRKERLNGDYDEFPRHRVHLSKAFYMSATQVTNQQYEQFDPAHRAVRGKLGFSSADDEAVVFVDWHDAVAFCAWLSEREGLLYRLPTEAEWEYACRAGSITAYHTGEFLPASGHKNQRESWYPEPVRSESTDIVPLHVGVSEPNSWGLYDMHGNVEEWCLDWYGPYLGSEQTDPVGYMDGDFRVTRGGSHSTEVYYLRSANRMAALPQDRSWLIGFRPVIAAAPQTEFLPAPPPAYHQLHIVRREPTNPIDNQAQDELHFSGPTPFVNIPAGSCGPTYSEHNHLPSVIECPNGDLLAVWFSCMRERGREMTLLASRRRRGHACWDPASLFWDAPDRNMTGSVLWRDGETIHLVGGLSAGATWGSMAMYVRTSLDSGASWSKAEYIEPDHGNGEVLPINLVFRTLIGSWVLPCDDGSVGGTRLYVRDDESGLWRDAGGRITGIHAAVEQLKDGRLLAFGREEDHNSQRMPQSISVDLGTTWNVTESPFDAVSDGQRPILMRLAEGPLFFASFAAGMPVADAAGSLRRVWGLFGAISYDEGESWPVRRLITNGGPARWIHGGAWTGNFLMSHTFAEPRGYLTATQADDGLIHLLTSGNHYALNLRWLETPPLSAEGDGLL